MVRMTAPTVTMPEMSSALGKLVSVHALAKFSRWMLVGSARPLPLSWSADFSAVTMVKYSGISTVRDSTVTRSVRGMLTEVRRRTLAGVAAATFAVVGLGVLMRSQPPCATVRAAAVGPGQR